MNARTKQILAIVFIAALGVYAGWMKQKRKDDAVHPWTQFQPHASAATSNKMSLSQARLNFTTKLVRHEAEHSPDPPPPPKLFRAVRYDSPAGKLAAYISQPAKDGQKHPAIVWIVGGFSNSVGDTPWEPASPDNDQSASAFWKAGIVTMYPSFRGGADNPGYKESFYGEVDDVIAAADYLAKQDYVDPNRIYLGGHSTGGTMALLAAECSGRFRAVFAFGPADDVGGYGAADLMFDTTNDKEFDLRAPKLWLNSVQNPTFVFEGTSHPSNADALRIMERASTNAKIHFYTVPGFSHFSILAPATRLLATKILSDDGPASNIAFTNAELVHLNFPQK